ncbi:vacuolar protein-sorting-associated protein 36-like [Eurytemora carolleeae]|uniref:vacuolar protein-sorting-associated protein 36-like n=1 Tax=Eurytemora carolleeae TaxID=1294199 RepID=UPI000C78126E|nr:vacuolar protein-sorting-associated protein 36-like [Eurytemora carolleeae]|eukprot:XP_023345754.1 vacuolar protein-sorting-associated protein 36-like [Eurytemora affinis]
MNRWKEDSGSVLEAETVIYRLDRTKLYHGDHKTEYEEGVVEVTSHRVNWKKNGKCLSLLLSMIRSTNYEEGGFMRSDKVEINLGGAEITKIGGKHGVQDLHIHLQKAIREEKWNVKQIKMPVKKEIRSGISGIEKNLQRKAEKDTQNISKAFRDLDRLMEMAKPMVGLAKSISSKIREKQGEITEDETVQFKSYLLSLGIDDPVTKDSAGSDRKYYQELAKEMLLVLDQPIQEAGGMITLTDAFVRVNRARGLELVSPGDIILACIAMKEIKLPMSLKTFPSGVMVLKSSNQSEKELLERIVYLVEAFNKISPDILARELKISVLLARERLSAAASTGHIVMDKSLHGIEYYPNRFLATT